MKKLFLATTALNTDLATLLLRLIFGGLFMYFGYNKVVHYNDIAPNFPDYLRIGGEAAFILVIFAELICGFFVLIGFATRVTVVPIFITMIVAFFVAHAGDPFDKKIEAFLFMLLCFVVFILGSGKYSVDKAIFKRFQNSKPAHL